MPYPGVGTVVLPLLPSLLLLLVLLPTRIAAIAAHNITAAAAVAAAAQVLLVPLPQSCSRAYIRMVQLAHVA